jgi:phage tail-like protein
VGTEDGGGVTGDRFDVRIGGRPIGLCHVGPITSLSSPDGATVLPPIVLRRAIGPDQTLWEWHTAAQESRRAHRIVSIALLTSDGRPLVTWRLEGCRPVRWSGPTLDTMAPAIACEEMEIAFDRVTWS